MRLGTLFIVRSCLLLVGLSVICTCTRSYGHTGDEVACNVVAIDHQKHPFFDVVCQEINNLKKSFPQQSSFFITLDTAPQLYQFLMPTIQKFCQTANIATVPYLIIKVGNTSETFNAQSNACSIYMGEHFLKLFLWNHRFTSCIFSIIAHELGHLFYEAHEQSKADSETCADEFALKLTHEQDCLTTALRLMTFAILLCNTLNQNSSTLDDIISRVYQNNDGKPSALFIQLTETDPSLYQRIKHLQSCPV